MGALFLTDVPIHCIQEAAVQYHVPAKLIITVLNIERGKTGALVKNKNRTYDVGILQINSSWLPILNSYGISQHDLQWDPCTNVKIGTWLLAKSIANEKDLLKGISNYHSHTPYFNQRYSQQVKIRFTQLTNVLKN